jgi:hypothetical protein
VRVTFVKLEIKGRTLCRWDADRGKRRLVPGSTMGTGKDLPHDLAQYVIEAGAGYANGFWGLVAKGATFKSTGRRRTKPGRALIADHRQDLDGSERLAGFYLGLWKAKHADAVTHALDLALAQWRALRPGEALVFAWPSARGTIESSDQRQSA